MRRANGTGTVTKLKDKRRRPFQAFTPAVLNVETGKWERTLIGFFATRDEANIALAKYNKGDLREGRAPTLEELYLSFYEEKKVEGRTEATLKMYRDTWKHMECHASVRVDEIKTVDIQTVVNNLVDEGKGYSTCDKVKKQYSQLLKKAVLDDFISKDYSAGVKIPKKPDSDVSVFSDLDIEKLKQAADKGDSVAGSIVVMIYTGMRVGELLSLTKFNVDLERGFIFGGNKTEAGKNRKIPIHRCVEPILKRAYERAEDRLFPIGYRKYTDEYKNTLKRLDIEYLSTHKCRKTFATRMHRLGVDDITLERLVGHTDISTTDKYYINVGDEKLKEAVDRLA